MKKIFVLVLIIAGVLLRPQLSFSSSYIYDEGKKLIYVGGYPIENLRREIDKFKGRYLKNKIYEINIKNGTMKLLINNSDNRILTYEISSKGYIAVSTSRKDKKRKEYKNDLILYNNNGEKIKIIEDVPVWDIAKHFSWSKGGDKIVYISGRVIIEGYNPFEPTGIWIYDLGNDKAVKIADKGVKVNWSRHDNNIYIQNEFNFIDPTSISVYNTSTGKLTKTDRRGIIFSDDGKFCIGTEVKKYEYPLYIHYIYNNITNEKIYKFKEEDGVQYEITSNLRFISNRDYLLMWEGTFYKIFDVETKKNLRVAKKQGLVGWNKDMTKVVVYEGGNQIHIDELLTGRRLQSIDIPESRY